MIVGMNHFTVTAEDEKTTLDFYTGLLGLKIGLAAMLTCLPRWRVAAAGLLTSMFAGAMIFLFTCGGSW